MPSLRRPDADGALAVGTQTVLFTPKDVMSFELSPFSRLDAQFMEWLREECGSETRVLVWRGWKALPSASVRTL